MRWQIVDNAAPPTMKTISVRAIARRQVIGRTKAAGAVAGFTGYDDDVPLRPLGTFDEGMYAAFLTNDPVDGRTSLDDTNDRVMVTAIGTGPGNALEIVQAIVERDAYPDLPATITIVGPVPVFEGGNSKGKRPSRSSKGPARALTKGPPVL